MPTDAAAPAGISGRRLLLVCLAIFLVAAAILSVTLWTRRPDPKLDDYGEVPAFSLTDEQGHVFTQEALRGHVTIVSFIFTRCDNLCPLTSMRMQHIQERTGDAGDRIKLLSFSVDPRYDTPPRLAAYAQRYTADPTRWHFVTGDYDLVHSLVENTFYNSMQRDPDRPSGAPNIAHTGFFALVDPTLHIRGFYDSSEPAKLDAIIQDARFLARTML